MSIINYAAADKGFSMVDFTVRCISNLIIICAARLIILVRYPHFFVSLKSPLKKAITSAELHELVFNANLNESAEITSKGNHEGPKVHVVVSIRKPFEYQMRDTIGIAILGPKFFDRYLYKHIQRIYSEYYLVSLIPCNWYMISMLINSNGPNMPLSNMDMLVAFFTVLPLIPSLLFTNPKLLSLTCQSLDIYMVLVPYAILNSTLSYKTYGTNMIIFPAVVITLSWAFAFQDAHLHRRTFSLIKEIYFIHHLVVIYISLVYDFFPFDDVFISVPGVRKISIKSMCVGWTITLLILLVRNIYQ